MTSIRPQHTIVDRYGLILCYIAFALFPLFWLLKVSITPNDLLYSEGMRLWPSRSSLAHYTFVLTHSDFPLFFKNSLIVSGRTAVMVTLMRLSPAMPCLASIFAARCGLSR